MNLYSKLKGLLMIAPKTDVRYYLCGVYVTATRLSASDGHTALTVEHEGNPLQEPVIICRHDLARKLKMFTAKSDLILCFDTGGNPSLKDGIEGEEISLLVIDGRYPDLNRALSNMKGKTPAQYSAIGFNLTLMAALCKAVDTVAADRKLHVGRFDFYGPDGGCKISRGDINGYLMPARL